LSYLTWREYTRSGPVCFGALLVIGGAIIALLASTYPADYSFFGDYTVMIGAIVAVVGLLFIIMGFVFTRRKRDSVLRPVDTKVDDTPPPPPPPD
jgi:membrane associated rhomboid family serine protease